MRSFSLAMVMLLGAGALCRAGEFPGHKLLMTSVRTGDTEIFLVDPMTGDAWNLTRSPGSEERYPNWSPDGSKIAFTSDRDGTYNLYVMDADGENVRQLTHEKAPTVTYFPSWSGDGRQIVFGLHGEKALMCTIAPDGSGFKVLGEGRDPNISPDSKTIAFTKKLSKGFVVFAMDVDGKNVRQLTTHENEIGAVTPTFSPDGRNILYSDQVGDALEIFIVDAAGGNIKQLTSLGKIATSPAWSPDMKSITFRVTDEAYWRDPERMKKAYADKEGDKRPVWVMAADGSNPHILEVLHYQCGIDGSRAPWKPR